MTAVFISYSRQDQDFVRRLHAALDAQGRDAWVDWQGIAPTAEWMAEIQRAIDGADAALFVISPAWVASRVCAQELEHAVHQGKRLVPVLWRDAPTGSVSEALARLNWVMLREGDDFDEGVRRLVAGLDVDLDWVRDHTRLIVRAQEWQAAGGDEAGLLRGRELDAAERWLAAGASHTDPAPVPLQAAYVTRSREAARRRQHITRALGLAALVIATILAIWALIERDSAIDNAAAARLQEDKARKNEARALEQEGIAKAQTLVAQQQTEAAQKARDAEEVQRKAAQVAQLEAERQRDEAVRQRIAAQARQLAARAEAQPVADPALLQRSALLAAESLRLLPNLDADQVLRRAIARLPLRHAELPHAGIVDTDAVASDGGFVALVDAQGLLGVVDAGRMREVFRFDTGGRARHVHVDRAGRFVLLTSPRDGTVLLFTNGDAPRRIEDCDAVGAAFGGPRATLLAIGCQRELRVIDAEDASVPARVFDKADGTQLALDYNGASEQLAGVDSKGDVTVWNVADGKRIARVRGQDSSSNFWSLCCTAFIRYSASGDYIAANNLADNRLHVISTRTWETHARLAHESRVNVFAFDEERDLLASGERSGRITVWDVPARAIVARMSHGDEITGLRLYAGRGGNRDTGPELLSASTDRTGRVWNPFSGAELTRASQISPVIWIGRPWEPHFGRRFATLDSRTGLMQWDMRPLGPPMNLPAQRGGGMPVLNCSEPSRQRHWLADAAGVVAWDAARPGQPDYLPSLTRSGRAVAFDPACRWIAVASGGELRILDPAARGGSAERPLFTDRLGPGSAADWWRSPRGALLAQRDVGDGGRVWRISPWSRLDPGPDCKVGAIVASPDERAVALGCDGDVRVLDVATGRQTARLALPGPVALTDDGHLVLRWRRELSVRRLPQGRQVARIELPESMNHGTLALDAGNRWLAIAGDDAVALWRVPTLERKVLEQRSSIASPAGPRKPFAGALQFSPDGRHLLVHGFDRLSVFDTEPWALRSELIHPGEAELVHWDLATRRVLAQVRHRPLDRDDQRSVRGWNIDNGAELLRIALERAAANLTVSADGRFLLADQVYRLSTAELMATACRLVARNLTPREWQTELGNSPYRRTCPNLPEPPPATASWDQ